MSALPRVPSPLVLVGFMGAGKSTLGRLLAQRLGWRFCDLDQRIEAAAGLSISAIFAQQGEPAYRELEHLELLQALRETAGRPTVLALGGGTVVLPQNREALQTSGGCSVFLDVPIGELMLRCAGMTNRPLFRDAESFRALYEFRLPFYRLARLAVPADDVPELVLERLLAQFDA
jgi:shikimate kinase